MTPPIDFDGLSRRIDDGIERGLTLASEHLLAESRRVVPHEEGTLERSGKATVDGNTAAVSYNTPYAVAQHEDLNMRHDDGRSAKYLERPRNREADTMLAIIAHQVRDSIGGAGR